MDELAFPLPSPLPLDTLRREIIGGNLDIPTPYGTRRMIYADYTASGRSLRFVEQALMAAEETYANTHTEDNASGSLTTSLYHEAWHDIRRLLGGTKDYVVVLAGTGATGAIHRLTQLLGVHEAPAARLRRMQTEDLLAEESPQMAGAVDRLRALRKARRPVVFLTPYEHHSNVLPWREAEVDVVEIGLTDAGQPDMVDLAAKLSLAMYADRLKIGAFSAASNVTGRISPVREMARLMHRHNGLAFFDYAASAPYVPIRLWEGDEDYLDGITLSPHKFLGGPGASGLLVFHRRTYDDHLAPSLPGGGTVDYVNASAQDYKPDVETREDGGTPPILQAMRIAMAMRVKDAVGEARIGQVEHRFRQRALAAWTRHPAFAGIGLGAQEELDDPERFLAIISFNLRHDKGMLHPRFVTRLLNDLFGIQARAGCSCAGPFGHRLLGIGDEKSTRFREAIHSGCEAMKPGWVRIGFHYTMDEATFQTIVDAVLYLADHGIEHLPDYLLDPASGLWTHHKTDTPTTITWFGEETWPELAWFPVAQVRELSCR